MAHTKSWLSPDWWWFPSIRLCQLHLCSVRVGCFVHVKPTLSSLELRSAMISQPPSEFPYTQTWNNARKQFALVDSFSPSVSLLSSDASRRLKLRELQMVSASLWYFAVSPLCLCHEQTLHDGRGGSPTENGSSVSLHLICGSRRV